MPPGESAAKPAPFESFPLNPFNCFDDDPAHVAFMIQRGDPGVPGEVYRGEYVTQIPRWQTWAKGAQARCIVHRPGRSLPLLDPASLISVFRSQRNRDVFIRKKFSHKAAKKSSTWTASQDTISRKSYWRLSRTPATRIAMPNKWLAELGLLSLKQLWCDLAPLRGTAW